MSTWPLPHKFGRYELIEFLGGGMSHVYRARDTLIGRIVAVKVLTNEGSTNEDVRTRFLREAQTAGQISTHPNIIAVYDFGQEQGRPFMVMEFLQGNDLRGLIDKGEVGSDARRLDIAIEAAKALEFIHTQRIIHRDIKPDNIHISHSGVVKLIDFGIAKTDELGITKAGYTLGTPYYMAPEQVTGQGITHSVDIYAFGIMLFEIFSGVRPIEADSIQQIFYKILKEPLNLTPLLDANPPDGMLELVAACTQKEPAKRPASFTDVIEHLRRIRNVATGEMAASGLSATKMLLTPEEMETRLSPNNAIDDAATIAGPVVPAAADVPPEPRVPPRNPETPIVSQHAPKPITPPAETPAPAAEAPREPSPAAQPAPAPTSRTWIYLLAAVLSIGILVVLGWRLMRPTPSGPTVTPPKELATVITTSTGRMFLVPAGSFAFGAQNEMVELPAFYVDETEVTVRDYMAFCAARGKQLPPDVDSSKPDLPITNITYLDAQEFAEWAGKRIPTAQEWEKAARNDDRRMYPWGNEHDPTRAVVADNAELNPKGPQSVDSLPAGASGVGALHLAGNVWEFVKDPHTPSMEALEHFSKLLNPPPTISEPWYSIRGGGFNAPLAQDVNVEFASVPARLADPAIGFRCVKDPEP